MTLNDLLLQLNPDEDVYIGSKSAFFFMDKPSVFFEKQEKMNDKFRKRFKRTMQNSKTKYNLYKTQEPRKGVGTKRRIWTEFGFKDIVIPYEKLYADWSEKMKELEVNLKRSVNNYETYKPLLERTVKRHYMNIGRTARIVIVEGEEAARFWLKSE